MIYVRDDDVLIDSSSHKDPVKHFKTVHEWICETPKLLHRPGILVHNVKKDGTRGLSGFPEAMEYIKAETAAGRMAPQIHGYEHIDYGKLSSQEVADHLRYCQDFIWKNFNFDPLIWYTPWGASAPHLHEVTELMGIKLVDCSKIHKLAGRHGVVQRLRDGDDGTYLEEDEIFFHWWEGGVRLKRVIEFFKHGTWDKAKENNGDWF